MTKPNSRAPRQPITTALYGPKQGRKKSAAPSKPRRSQPQGSTIGALIPEDVAKALGWNPLTGRLRGAPPRKQRRKGAR